MLKSQFLAILLATDSLKKRKCYRFADSKPIHVLFVDTVVVVVVVMVAFSSRARILGECSTNLSPPTRFVFF